MFGLEDSRRYYVCQRYVRMNMGINGLSNIVSHELKRPLLSGDVFIFFGKNRQMVKLLCWDGDGFLLYQKHLEKGTFELPLFKPGQKAAEMPYRTLSAIMGTAHGDWSGVRNCHNCNCHSRGHQAGQDNSPELLA